jgi:hypothetical protein
MEQVPKNYGILKKDYIGKEALIDIILNGIILNGIKE